MGNRDWAYDYDGAGRAFLKDTIIDHIDDLLDDRGVTTLDEDYEIEFDNELEKFFKREEAAYDDYLTEKARSRMEGF